MAKSKYVGDPVEPDTQEDADASAPAEGTEKGEAKPVKVTGPINIRGDAYNAGDTVMLTDEELEAVKASGSPIEGVDPLDEEALQSKHDEGVEAQKKRLEDDQKALDERDQKAKDKSKGKDEGYQAAETDEQPRDEHRSKRQPQF